MKYYKKGQALQNWKSINTKQGIFALLKGWVRDITKQAT